MIGRNVTTDPRFQMPDSTRVLSMSELGALVRQRRRELGYTQEQVSSFTGFSPRLVGEIERGKEHVAMDKILCLMDVLNMTLVVHVEGR